MRGFFAGVGCFAIAVVGGALMLVDSLIVGGFLLGLASNIGAAFGATWAALSDPATLPPKLPDSSRRARMDVAPTLPATRRLTLLSF